jgi:hypothetical protein|tara:strand:+ start:18920 stop:19084 length:165 start_codon:yes stop_codon:yes gene_type:complete
MATVYKLEVKTVSPWAAYPPEAVAKLIKDFLENYENEQGLGFESTEIFNDGRKI